VVIGSLAAYFFLTQSIRIDGSFKSVYDYLGTVKLPELLNILPRIYDL
jgi:hypothetical protein